MEAIPQLLVLALVSVVLAAVAAWCLAMPFPAALVLVLAGVLARDFVAVAGIAPARAAGMAALVRDGSALALRLLVGTATLAIMLLAALWMLHPAA